MARERRGASRCLKPIGVCEEWQMHVFWPLVVRTTMGIPWSSLRQSHRCLGYIHDIRTPFTPLQLGALQIAYQTTAQWPLRGSACLNGCCMRVLTDMSQLGPSIVFRSNSVKYRLSAANAWDVSTSHTSNLSQCHPSHEKLFFTPALSCMMLRIESGPIFSPKRSVATPQRRPQLWTARLVTAPGGAK